MRLQVTNWLFGRTGFVTQEMDANLKLISAFEGARNRKAVRPWDRQLLRLPGFNLRAVGKHGRIAWAKAVCQEFAAHFDLGPDHTYPDQPLYFLTLVDHRCSTTHDAAEVDFSSFTKRFRKGLSGVSYVGMLEPAYYVNIAKGARHKNKQAMFWHIHAVLWGLTKAEAKTLEAKLNRTYQSIADGLDAARIKRIIKTEKHTYHLGIKLRYMFKTPKHVYRLRKVEESITDDGEIVSRFQQGSTDLRAGERISLFQIMKPLYLDRLSLAGGEGVEILRRAKRRALPKRQLPARRKHAPGLRKARRPQ